MLNVKSNLGYALMLAYILGNAMTYNHLVKVGSAAVTGDRTMFFIKNLLVAAVWPFYWLGLVSA